MGVALATPIFREIGKFSINPYLNLRFLQANHFLQNGERHKLRLQLLLQKPNQDRGNKAGACEA